MDNETSAREAWRVQRIQSELVNGIDHLAHLGASVTVYGSARLAEDSLWYQKAVELGERFAIAGINVLTGGGPGIMEGANRGAFGQGAHSIGLNVELEHEQHPNTYQDISLQFRYFFVRKLMFVKHALGFVVFPGGFGTLDELFEALTLIQTHKIKPFPVVLMGVDYWQGLVDWMRDRLLTEGCISEKDLDLFVLADETEVAFETITRSAASRRVIDNLPSPW
jgi:uncharacterized protein (TIGR00730 family)